MDLNHVCVLHRRWFRNLRIRVQRPDYVEYRLTSLFYGIPQELLVRGGPMDESRYWYEFIGPLASIRVDGQLEGPDGNLNQTEHITYGFAWPLAPFFWMLKPLFRRQKEDILADDSALLERVYALDRSGFKRLEYRVPRVVVYGGDGFFGRLLVEDLLKHSTAQVSIASRNPDTGLFEAFRNRVTYYESDLNDRASVLATLEGADVAICCAGPFQDMRPSLLQACIEKRVHYIDVADDRAFVEEAYKLEAEIRAAGITALIGCSVVPGLSALLTQRCLPATGAARRVRIFITPGTKRPRGYGSFACLLSTLAKEYQIPANGQTRAVTGWSERERVEFPPPLRTRSVYLVVDIADYWTQRHYFGTDSVEFKIGSELEFLNRSFSILRWIKGTFGIAEKRWLLTIFRRIVWLAGLFGSTQGAVRVTVEGTQGEATLSVYAAEGGEIIPALLPSLAAQMLLAGELRHPGIAPLPVWLDFGKLTREFASRGIRIAERGVGGSWHDVGSAEAQGRFAE